MHSAIERAKRHVQVFVPTDWHNILRVARRGNPYQIIPMGYRDFTDYKAVHALVPNTKVDTDGKAVRWSKICAVQLTKETPQEISVKYDFDGAEHTIDLAGKHTRSRKKRSQKKLHFAHLGVDENPKYRERIPISDAKKSDLIRLCTSGVIPGIYRPYYEGLPDQNNVVDRLAEPDVLEQSEDEE